MIERVSICELFVWQGFFCQQLLHLIHTIDGLFVCFEYASFDECVGLLPVSEILKLSLVQYMHRISRTLSSSEGHCVP